MFILVLVSLIIQLHSTRYTCGGTVAKTVKKMIVSGGSCCWIVHWDFNIKSMLNREKENPSCTRGLDTSTVHVNLPPYLVAYRFG